MFLCTHTHKLIIFRNAICVKYNQRCHKDSDRNKNTSWHPPPSSRGQLTDVGADVKGDTSVMFGSAVGQGVFRGSVTYTVFLPSPSEFLEG